MGGEYVHLRRFHSDEVMVIVLIAECASKTHSNFKSTMDRNCYDWLKKYTVSKVVARDNGGCVRKKGSFDGRAQPRTQPQIAVFVSEVVIAKVTQNTVFSCFSEKRFWLCPFLYNFRSAIGR